MHNTAKAEDHLSQGGESNDVVSPEQFLDYRHLDWTKLLRASYLVEQRFEYAYPGPIYGLHQRLIVVPPNQLGDQQLRSHKLDVSAPLAVTTSEFDSFGNQVMRVTVPQVEERIAFDLRMVIERDFSNTTPVRIAMTDAMRYSRPTYLTTANEEIKAVAHSLLAQSSEPEEFAEASSSWIHETMAYAFGVTAVHTTAAEALGVRQGLCQDYAHIMLAICRAAGFCARYVSGHLLGEGVSHAWVELLTLDGQGSYRAIAIDPTNHRRKTPAYLTIAVGRDYSDISPTSGTFTAPYSGQLHSSKRAGITHVELRPES